MRFCIAACAPLLAVVYAQSTTSTAMIVSAESTTSTSSYAYSNPNTYFLTETNSYGVVTGQPSVPSNTDVAATAVTTQPKVATIPAGLPAGTHTIYYGNATSFVISVGSSTTEVLGATDASVVTGATAGLATGSGAAATSGSASGSGSASATGSSASAAGTSAATSSSAAQANSVKVASGAFFGLGAFVVALL